jgi:hypothetical protein
MPKLMLPSQASFLSKLKRLSQVSFLPKLKRTAVIGAPHHHSHPQLLKCCSRTEKTHPSQLLGPGESPGVHALPRCMEPGSCHTTAEDVRGAVPLALCVEEPQFHPPPLGCRDGDDDRCELQNPSKQHLLLLELQDCCVPSYKGILLHHVDSSCQRSLNLPPTVEDSDATWMVVKNKRSRAHSMPQAVSEAR